MRSLLAFFIVSSVHFPAFAEIPQEITNSIGMKLVLIPKGTFTMGSPPGEEDSEENENQHEVTLSQDYYLGAFEVTQAQYKKVMGNNPSRFQGDMVAEHHPKTGRKVRDVDSSTRPVDQVSLMDALSFCKRLSALPEEKKAGRKYFLPTEAQWEYACRAGSKTAFSFGESAKPLGDYAWYKGNSKYQTHPVGEKKPNAWGLYDMHGNVCEWCSDQYRYYPRHAVTDPVGRSEEFEYMFRGGDWDHEPKFCRSAARVKGDPSIRYEGRGFRVTLSPPEIPE